MFGGDFFSDSAARPLLLNELDASVPTQRSPARNVAMSAFNLVWPERFFIPSGSAGIPRRSGLIVPRTWQITQGKPGGGMRKPVSILHRLTLSKAFHRGIQRRVKLVHRRFAFVAHVGNAKGRAFDFPIAAINEETLVFDQFLQFHD